MVMSRDQHVGQNRNKVWLKILLKVSNSSDIWKQCKQITIPFLNKLRADWSQGMHAIIRCRIVYYPVCYPKI